MNHEKLFSTLNLVKMLSFIIFILCLEKSCANDLGTLSEPGGTTEDLPSLRNLCPYNKFCQSAPLKELQISDQQVSCCEECSCDIDCFETGSCCPDVPFTRPIEPKYPCRRLSYFGKNVASIYKADYSDYWYHVIDDCPNMSKSLAYKRCYNKTEFHDYVMVSDTRTGRVYRNKQCAECNDIFNYVELKLQANCKNVLSSLSNLSSIQETQRYLMEECALKSFPPETNNSLSRCLPETSVISSCNSTGLWDFHDKETERACLTKRMDQNVLYKSMLPTGTFYESFENVYCFLCNVPKNTKQDNLCDKFGYQEGGKSGFVSFFAIIDTKIWEDDDELKQVGRCLLTQIWDTIQKICRQLFCPPGHVPYYGSCKTLFSNIYGYTFSIHFKVIIKNGTIYPGSVLIKYLENRFIRALGDDIVCGKCRASLYSEKNSTQQIYFRYVMFAKEGCRYQTLLAKIRKIAIEKKLSLKLRYGSQVIRISMVLVYREITGATGYNYQHGNVHTFCDTEEVIDESILEYCPAIMLSKEEVYALKLRNPSSVTTSFFFQSNVSRSVSQRMCVDIYFSASPAKSAAELVVRFTMYQVYGLLTILFVLL